MNAEPEEQMRGSGQIIRVIYPRGVWERDGQLAQRLLQHQCRCTFSLEWSFLLYVETLLPFSS